MSARGCRPRTGRANVELSEALLAQAQREQTAGTGTGIEVTRAEVQLANDRQNLIRAENDRTRAVLQLLKSMGLHLDASVEFTDKLVYKPIDPASSETLLEEARKARFELKTQQQREEAARLSHSAVKVGALAQRRRFGDYGAIGTDVASARATYTMGVSLSVPVFDGGNRASPPRRKLLAIQTGADSHAGPGAADRTGGADGARKPALGRG